MNGRGRLFIEVLRILRLLFQNNDGDDASSPAFHVVGPLAAKLRLQSGCPNEVLGWLSMQKPATSRCTNWGTLSMSRRLVTGGIGLLELLGSSILKAVGRAIIIWPTRAHRLSKLILYLHYRMHYYHTARMYRRALKRNELFGREGKGYNYIESTKPQNTRLRSPRLPIALLAWIYEKLHDWSDAYPWTDDEILTWICIYAFSRAGPGAAHRIYFEVAHADAAIKNQYGKLVTLNYGGMLEYTEEVKIGLTYNPKELEALPTRWGGTFGNVVLSGGG
ncbi:epoxide hydrolase [Blastomyces gilchristii SLH14081]|uniref:Epoxide hydrolase n=1 Tax=Blastomyces gilchristii (strain SLH14081) TaxID=559298 RepID=A0A179UVB8_BLAGS|nr:epoxide hydrolase [Blastomyces gilchristii SLH14081]OAT10342.1 epoxide hydrolase [Blastomyces gilchristii SLH14081]